MNVYTIPVTTENQDALADLGLFRSQLLYLGEHCKYCRKRYSTIKDLMDTVGAGRHKRGWLACEACWRKYNSQIPATAEGLRYRALRRAERIAYNKEKEAIRKWTRKMSQPVPRKAYQEWRRVADELLAAQRQHAEWFRE
jgi:hypothetical protein